MFTVASRFRRLKFVGSYLSTIEAVGTGSWLSVVQVLLDVSIALLVAIIEFHGGIHRGYRTISSEFFFVKRYTQSDLKINLGCFLWFEIFFVEIFHSRTPTRKDPSFQNQEKSREPLQNPNQLGQQLEFLKSKKIEKP